MRKVGDSLKTIDDIMANPNLLSGKQPQEVEVILGKTLGWKIETLGQGTHQGQGWVLREYTSVGNKTGRMLRWHPGNSRYHGVEPYWRVIGYEGNIGGIIR